MTPHVMPAPRLRAAVPVRIRKRYYDLWCRYVLWAVIRRLRSLAPGELPTHDVLSGLRKGWNNGRWTAHIGLMEAIARHVAQGKGPILECGSGSTTVLLAAMAKANGRRVWSLEEQEHWATKVNKIVRQFGSAQVLYRPVVDYGEFEWFEMHGDLPAQFGLVVCDGPRSWVKGGRGGLYEMMSTRFSADCMILMDDAQRAKERRHMREWHEKFDAEFEIVRAEGRPYGLVKPGAQVEPPQRVPQETTASP